MDNLYELAKQITRAGKIIAADPVAKDYLLIPRYGYINNIWVTSDSGFEAIVIGDTNSCNSRGYMYLYHKNTPKRNSFPSATKIAKLLKDVCEKKPLETGEGKAAYYDWEEYGSLEKQRDYFSQVVTDIAAWFKRKELIE